MKDAIKNFTILEPIGTQEIREGYFGEVFEGNHKGKHIAIKVMKLDWTAIREANIMNSKMYTIN